MNLLSIPREPPSRDTLLRLAEDCRRCLAALHDDESEVRLPIFVEFAGSPKSGKTSIIGIVSHFFRRMGLNVVQPAEGASLRTPPGLRDDWMAFNAWSGCYALQQILIDAHSDPPADLVILDRGLFDVAGWFSFLETKQGRVTREDRRKIVDFFLMDLWSSRLGLVFVFTADHETSLHREIDSKLTDEPGTVMNKDTLNALLEAYKSTGAEFSRAFPHLHHVGTSRVAGRPPLFQSVAYAVAEAIVARLKECTTQMLLVTDTVDFEGFVKKEEKPNLVHDTIEHILNHGNPRFLERSVAEECREVQQIVPYALLHDGKGRYFHAKRRCDVRRSELRGRYTILVGGHAEKKDLRKEAVATVFENCLRRELEEELVGINIEKVEPIGFISDTRNGMGSRHLAFIHRVDVGGRPLVRRQAVDQEFGRESVSWKTPPEIAAGVASLDPWSQLVAHGLFGAKLTSEQNGETLFNQNGSQTR